MSHHRGRMSILLETVTVATAIACGLVGGVFFAFSNFVMAALGARPDREGLAAMQAINVTVLNPLFMLLLFGPVVACAGLAIAALGDLGEAHAPWLLAGALLYCSAAPASRSRSTSRSTSSCAARRPATPPRRRSGAATSPAGPPTTRCAPSPRSPARPRS